MCSFSLAHLAMPDSAVSVDRFVQINSPPASSSSSAACRHPAVSPAKLNGLVGLLSRCPRCWGGRRSRRSRSRSTTGGGIDVGGGDVVPSSDDRTWNADYLNGYAIDYREDEEFDHDGGGGGGEGGIIVMGGGEVDNPPRGG